MSFTKKKTMLKMVIDHYKEWLDHGDTIDKNEIFWDQLTEILNNINEKEQSSEEWKMTWKYWVTSVQLRKNDLSITLLDLQLLNFLYETKNMKSDISDSTKKIVRTSSNLISNKLSSIIDNIPQLARNSQLIKQVNRLQDLEVREAQIESEIKIDVIAITDLLCQISEIESKINRITENWDIKEEELADVASEKAGIRNVIKSHIKLFTGKASYK